MQLTLQSPLDKGRIQATESAFGQFFHDRQDIPVQAGEALEFADYEHVGVAELIEELTELRTLTNNMIHEIEREVSADLGPGRFAQLKELLLRVHESDRMI
jgi:hypothetical protein